MKIGTNLSGPITFASSEQPFLNIFKTGVGWGTLNSGSGTAENVLLYTSFLDANGYPTTLTGGVTHTFNQVNTLLLQTIASADGGGGTYPAGNYVFLYDGTGTFDFSDDFAAGWASPVSSATGRVVMSVPAPSSAGTFFTLKTTGAGAAYARNFRLVYSPDSGSGSGAGTVVGVNGLGTREALLNAGEIFNPTFISRIQEFKTLRFMDWMSTINNFQTNWSDRHLPGWVFYGDSPTNATINGADTRPTQGPGISDGVPAEVLFSLCNKIGADGWFCMPPLATDSYVTSFATLAHSSLNSNLKAYAEYANELWNQQFAGASGTMVNTVATQICNLCKVAFSGVNSDTQFNNLTRYSAYASVRVGALWKAAWGADAARVIRVFGGWNGNPAHASFWLAETASNLNYIGPNPWSGTVGANVDALAVAPYFNYETPDGWNLDQLCAELTTATLPTSSMGTVTGTTTAYALTTGLTLPSTPAHNTIVAFTVGVALDNGSGITLAADGGTAFPIQLNDGNTTSSAVGAGFFTAGNTYSLAFTTNINGVAVTTPGWRYFLAGTGSVAGMVGQATSAIGSNKTTATSYSIPLVGYEGGQQLLSGSNLVLRALIFAANRDPRMGAAYTAMLNSWNGQGGDVICVFTDIEAYTQFGQWGALENVQQTHTPKYDALLQLLNPLRRGMNVRGGF